MAQYLTPGVYVEEVSFRAPSIEGVGTSTAAFAGPTLTGPVNATSELLTSFGDFQNIYGSYDNLALSGITPGDPKNTNYLALAVKAFFDNGGSQLYVSRVFSPASGTDSGIATGGTVSDTGVAVAARFPGAYGNQQLIVTLKATRAQTVANLPQGSLIAARVPPAATSFATLTAQVGLADTQIVTSAAFSAALPAFITVDSEVMSVTAVDATGTKLTVSRAAGTSTAAMHSANAQVYLPVASLQALVTPTGATITLAAPIAGTLAAGAFLQIDQEIVEVTSVEPIGTTLNVARGAQGTTGVGHAAKAPIFVPATVDFDFYANGSNASFTDPGGVLLPTPVPPNLYLLTMSVTATGASGSPQVYDNLGFDPIHPSYIGATLAPTPPRHIDALENQIAFTMGAKLTTAFAVYNALFGSSGSVLSASQQVYTLTNGGDGVEPEANDYANALSYFTALEDVAIVATPGSGIFDASQDIINELIIHVSQQRAYRVAILETPPNQLASDNENVRGQIDSSYAALYAPWVVTDNPLARSGTAIPAEITVPPSGFIAGIYARSDEQNGVSKAPANAVVLGASRFERNISFAEQGVLNPLGINCLRYFPNRGYLVWGARTAASDSEFMYVNVRRYLIYLEHSIDNSTQWAVFENNGPPLWARVKEAIDSFLYNEWKEGSLLGDSAAQAYFVRCDRTTMTQNDLDNGRMICLIGVALLKPAEFVIFRIGQMTSDAQS